MSVFAAWLTLLVDAGFSRSGDWFYHFVEIMSLLAVIIGCFLLKVSWNIRCPAHHSLGAASCRLPVD